MTIRHTFHCATAILAAFLSPLSGLLAAPRASADLLPDLVVRSEYLAENYVDTLTQPGARLLRLSTGVANLGLGPLEVYGGDRVGPAGLEVYQRVHRADGSSWDRLAGQFGFHPTHGHFHLDDWTVFRLRAVLPNGDPGEALAVGEKTSFCLMDLIVDDPSRPGFPEEGVFDSCDHQRQGISPGWLDLYDSSLPDQWLDITGIPSGEYWLEVEVDPSDRILESDESNNVERLAIVIEQPPDAGPDRFEPNDSFDEVDARAEGGEDSPNLGLVNALTILESLSMDDDLDFFRFRTNQPGAPGSHIAIDSVYTIGDLDLFLYSGARTVIDRSVLESNSESISLEGLPAGDYYILVYRFSGEVADYTLRITPSVNSPPQIELLSPPEGRSWAERAMETAPVSWIASDPDGDATRVSLFFDADRVMDKASIALGAYQGLDGAHGLAHLNTATLPLGEWHLYAEITDGAGTQSAWAPGTLVLYEPGDTNFDGVVDLLDVFALLRERRRAVPRSRCGPPCDIDGDGCITPRDARKLIRLCTEDRCGASAKERRRLSKKYRRFIERSAHDRCERRKRRHK